MNKQTLLIISICLGTAIFVSVLFYAIAIMKSGYEISDIYIGTVWTFVLALIISSPVLIPFIKDRFRS